MEVSMPDMYVCKTGLRAPDNNEAPVYVCYKDNRYKDRLWLVQRNCVNPGDTVHCGYPYDTKSQGYAGRWLVFPTADGTTITLQGPWHSNADALFEYTGIDVRSKHYCQVVIGKDFAAGPPSMNVITGLLYYEEPCVQSYDRYKDLLYDLMTQHPELDKLVYNHAGGGGASTGTYSRKRDYERDSR